jgi:Xaa-Pro aminopeptidase
LNEERYRERQRRALAALSGTGAEALMVTRPENRTYLTGFRGDAGTVFLSSDGVWLLTDFRFLEAAKDQGVAAELVHQEGSWLDSVTRLVTARGWSVLAFEADHLTCQRYQELSEALSPVALVASSGLVEGLRRIKDEEEIAWLREAARITDAAFVHILDRIRPGVTEKELALELEYFMGRSGAEGPGFPTIVAAGPRSAYPHAVPQREAVREGDLIILDLGAVYEGYHADLTRTVAVGCADGKQREVYDIVLCAQQKALAAIRPGRSAAEIDAVAREEITRKGYGEYFVHRLGHSVGLAVHEEPSLGSGQDAVLAPGMVLTVEPGIYLPGWGGVRIEDLVLVTEKGAEVISQAPRDFLIVGR